jgi:carbon starvation protein
MSLTFIVAASAVILLIAYRTYGFHLSRLLRIDDASPTPAHTLKDGIDYVPSKSPVVLGHHFASIAGAGPIVGPVIAVAFGWVPALIWILIGGIFFGAVHDLTSLMASVRHQGKSIGEVIQRYIGDTGKHLFMVFAFATLVLIIAVFMDIVAKTFVNVPSAASASLLFMGLAVVFGQAMRSSRLPFVLLTVLGVVAMYALIWVGTLWPVHLPYEAWIGILLAYCFAAAIAPVDVLLQPRDYLNSFLLYGMMLFGIAGIVAADPKIEMTSEVQFHVENLGYMFPLLFVTIACGAISGFHSLVASGTTSKQLNCETDARRVGYGGMLIESLLAVISVGTVVVMTKGAYADSLKALGPVTLYSNGLGGFISTLGIPVGLAVSFVALTVSAFAVTTLDTCTRLGRFVVQETVASLPANRLTVAANNRNLATGVVVVLSLGLLTTGQFTELWPIFGSANQLLAALALLAVTVWLSRSGINRLYTLIPMVFMFAVTLSSLAVFAWVRFQAGSYTLTVVAILLFILAAALIGLARRSLKTA